MLEKYTAPKAEVVCFAPVENLAADWYNWGQYLSFGGAAAAGASQVTFTVDSTNEEGQA